MNAEQIKILLAQQFITQIKTSRAAAGTYDAEPARAFMDRHIQIQSAQFLQQLKALAESDQADIDEAFSYFGAAQMATYINRSLAGYDELYAMEWLQKACIRLGNPDLSKEEIEQIAAEKKNSIYSSNPHMLIHSPIQKKMDEAVKEMYDGKRTPAELPVIADQMYLGVLVNTAEARCGEGLFENSIKLFDYAFEQFEQAKGNLTIDQELQLAGIVVLACRCLPEHDDYRHKWEDTSVLEYLKLSRASVAKFKELKDLLPPVDSLMKRVKELATKHELFRYPLTLADRIYDHDFEQKVRTVLATPIGLNVKPQQLEL